MEGGGGGRGAHHGCCCAPRIRCRGSQSTPQGLRMRHTRHRSRSSCGHRVHRTAERASGGATPAPTPARASGGGVPCFSVIWPSTVSIRSELWCHVSEDVSWFTAKRRSSRSGVALIEVVPSTSMQASALPVVASSLCETAAVVGAQAQAQQPLDRGPEHRRGAGGGSAIPRASGRVGCRTRACPPRSACGCCAGCGHRGR